MTGSSWYLSRLRLSPEASVRALLKAVGGDAPETGHALLWSLFADGADRKRDFLFREASPGVFFALSARAPEDRHRLWRIETKPFAPALAAGDRLRFSLRANPTVARKADGDRRSKRHDVVMNALRAVPSGDRAAPRGNVAREAGLAWLKRRGAAAGFEPADSVRVDGYRQWRIPRTNGAPMRLSSLDFDGELKVADPVAFLAALRQGFGAGKAFGFGLMLIRRA